MDPYHILDKYYSDNPELKHVLITHSQSVADKAEAIALTHPELEVDVEFIRQAALLHDIGIFLTDAPGIHCYGQHPYIAHGYLGADILRSEGFPRHALVCERHTGTGLSLDLIRERNLPLPQRGMKPISIEEQVICFADKFFSKSHIDREKSVDQARKSLLRFGNEGVEIFDNWCTLFL